MPIKQINTELGHSLPPEAPHNITFHIPGWDTAKALRRGDPELLSKLSSIYPRFGPWCEVRQLSTALHPLLDFPETHGLILFVRPPDPDILQTAVAFARSSHRQNKAAGTDHRIAPAELLFRAVDIPLTLPLPPPEPQQQEEEEEEADESDGVVVRLFAVGYPLARAPGAVGVWQNYGTGVSSRLAAALLPAVRAGRSRVLPWRADGASLLRLSPDGGGAGAGEGEGQAAAAVPPPEGTFLPLGKAHAALRRRIADLVANGAAAGDDGEGGEGNGQGKADGNGKKGARVTGEDVWLYPTGMAAIYRLHRALLEARGGKGTVVVLGSVFHNTWHLATENEAGMKHFGRCDPDDDVMDALEAWLEGEKAAGRKVAYVFAEFPSNPILVSVDLVRLREVTNKYSVPVVIDDTIGSFCNIDVSPFADAIVTSITKSVSGYANVMGGSVVLPPSSAHHAVLRSALAGQFRNEYFHADAARLLANTRSYVARSRILNRNALALATFLDDYRRRSRASASAETCPVAAVLYPPFTPTAANYAAVMRPHDAAVGGQQDGDGDGEGDGDGRRTTVGFEPGYGCLLAIEFVSLRVARAFYDNLSVYHGPHLGAHHTLAFPFNDAIWGTDPEAAAYLRTYGAKAEQVRVSVGLEDEQELIDTFKAALEVAEKVRQDELAE
ncbi:PLP-dependent transferase [Thermothelomyces heterothallicus CBS 203.75]